MLQLRLGKKWVSRVEGWRRHRKRERLRSALCYSIRGKIERPTSIFSPARKFYCTFVFCFTLNVRAHKILLIRKVNPLPERGTRFDDGNNAAARWKTNDDETVSTSHAGNLRIKSLDYRIIIYCPTTRARGIPTMNRPTLFMFIYERASPR